MVSINLTNCNYKDMKTKQLFYTLVSLLLVCTSCSEDDKINFTPSVNFSFATAENLVTVGKGTMEYTVKGAVTASTGLSSFVISTADTKTGAVIAEVKETQKVFENTPKSYEFTYTITDLTENKAISVSIVDGEGDSYKKNFVVQITPSVVFSDGTKNLESMDKFYGVFYAEWLDGRIYKSRDAVQYAKEINLAMDIKNNLPVLVSPARHSKTFTGARATKLGATTLTAAQFNGINRIDDALLKSASASAESIVIEKGKVYAYETQDGLKGLVYIQNLTGNAANETDPAVTAVIVTKVQAK